MTPERALAEWAVATRFEDLPASVVAGMKLLTRTIIGTAFAGARADGVATTIDQVREWGGAPQATIWVHGGKAPVHTAAFANSTMARALDICDAQVPGQHIGSSLIPTAFCMAELTGGATGQDFITALAVGAEIATRLGFVSRLDGFDPTGACSIFAPCIAAGRLLRLNPTQMLNAMALTFNRAGSSFQSNVDASLAVRLIQGFVSQNAVMCAQLAARNLTGPRNWLDGVWGYFHLFCKDQHDTQTLTANLGSIWFTETFGYKTRPQCGATISSTDAILSLMQQHPLEPEDIASIDIDMANEGPCNLVGAPFTVGPNPEVSGQFSVRYCVANAIVRKHASLEHFTPAAVNNPTVVALAQHIATHLKPELAEGRRELAAKVVLTVRLTDGRTLICSADGPSGFPPNPKSPEAHLQDFHAHLDFGGHAPSPQNRSAILQQTEHLDDSADVRSIIPLLASGAAQPA
jgi:2-methylcitrate dehydratase PrpD